MVESIFDLELHILSQLCSLLRLCAQKAQNLRECSYGPPGHNAAFRGKHKGRIEKEAGKGGRRAWVKGGDGGCG